MPDKEEMLGYVYTEGGERDFREAMKIFNAINNMSELGEYKNIIFRCTERGIQIVGEKE